MLAGCVPLLEVVRDNPFPAHLGCGRIHLCEGVEWRSTFSWSFPGGSDSKESAYNGGDRGSVPGLGRSPGEGNDNPLQYSCLENPMDRGAWQATVHGVEKSWTQLNIWALGLNNRYKWTLVKRSFHQGLPWWSSGRPLCFQCRGHIWSLVRELRSHMPGDTGKKKKQKQKTEVFTRPHHLPSWDEEGAVERVIGKWVQGVA